MRCNSDRLNVKRADVVRFRFVGEGYYVTAIYCKHIIEFCQHYVRHGEEIHTIYANKKGISINLQDEWNDFLLNIISSIHRHYQKFANAQPRCGCLHDDKGRHLGYKACMVCYRFGGQRRMHLLMHKQMCRVLD